MPSGRQVAMSRRAHHKRSRRSGSARGGRDVSITFGWNIPVSVTLSNYPHKLIPALHDRCQKMEFEALDPEEFLVRIGMILSLEKVTYDINTLGDYVNRAYPSLRKCINLTQEHIIAGRLEPLAVAEDNTGRDYILDSIHLFRSKDYITARKLIVTQATLE